jgi:hypothetical protein
MSTQQIIDLFDRWERVWHEVKLDLVPDCVAPLYVRHEEAGDRTVTPETYAAEIARAHQERPGIRIAVHDHSFGGNRAWLRFGVTWTDPATGETRSRAGMQLYRVEGGKLVETWVSLQPLGSTWSDKPQERWTSPPVAK